MIQTESCRGLLIKEKYLIRFGDSEAPKISEIRSYPVPKQVHAGSVIYLLQTQSPEMKGTPRMQRALFRAQFASERMVTQETLHSYHEEHRVSAAELAGEFKPATKSKSKPIFLWKFKNISKLEPPFLVPYNGERIWLHFTQYMIAQPVAKEGELGSDKAAAGAEEAEELADDVPVSPVAAAAAFEEVRKDAVAAETVVVADKASMQEPEPEELLGPPSGSESGAEDMATAATVATKEASAASVQDAAANADETGSPAKPSSAASKTAKQSPDNPEIDELGGGLALFDAETAEELELEQATRLQDQDTVPPQPPQH